MGDSYPVRGDHKANVPSHLCSKVSDWQSPHCRTAWRGGPVGMVFSSNGTEVAPLQCHPPFLHHPHPSNHPLSSSESPMPAKNLHLGILLLFILVVRFWPEEAVSGGCFG